MKNYKDLDIAHIKKNEYSDIYNESINNNEKFWSKISKRIHWFKDWEKISNVDFSKGVINWFENGKLNVSYNCLDRHVENGNGDDIALIWEGNNPSEDKKISYKELLVEDSKFSNVLKSKYVLFKILSASFDITLKQPLQLILQKLVSSISIHSNVSVDHIIQNTTV